jgi:hypothetical protein
MQSITLKPEETLGRGCRCSVCVDCYRYSSTALLASTQSLGVLPLASRSSPGLRYWQTGLHRALLILGRLVAERWARTLPHPPLRRYRGCRYPRDCITYKHVPLYSLLLRDIRPYVSGVISVCTKTFERPPSRISTYDIRNN